MNRLVAIALSALLAFAPAAAAAAGMSSPILISGAPASNTSTSAARLLPLANGSGASGYSSSNINARTPVAASGTVTTFYARVETAPGAGTSWTFVVQKNGADTTMSCTIADAATNCSDSGHQISVTEGTDDLDVKVTPASTPTTSAMQFAMGFTSTTDNEANIFTAHSSLSTANLFLPPGGAAGSTTTQENAKGILATGGSVTALYVRLSVAPGVGTSRTYTLQKGGSNALLTCTIADTATTCSDTTGGHATSLVAGDNIDVSETQSGSVAASSAQIGMKWVATTNGETPLFATSNGTISNSATRYIHAHGLAAGTATTDASAYNVAPIAFTLKAMRIEASAAPGGVGKTRTWNLRVNGGASSPLLTANITNAQTTTNDAVDQVSIGIGDTFDLETTVASTPASASNRVGMVAYIVPGAGAAARTCTFMLLGVGQC
jgi:hypothetical protein